MRTETLVACALILAASFVRGFALAAYADGHKNVERLLSFIEFLMILTAGMLL